MPLVPDGRAGAGPEDAGNGRLVGERRRECDGYRAENDDDAIRDGAREEGIPRARMGRAGLAILRRTGVAQSICLRMNVGISMSLRSCSARSAGGAAAAGRRAPISVLVAAGRGGGAVFKRATDGLRCEWSGMTGAPFGAMVSITGEVPVTLSNPVAMTVTRISPCMAGSWTAPKMISASSPTAS